ncbi:DUF3316 domain-containing protein [Vibrio sp. FNV 38]|nr:DUF3316 domain-containing protein [Vibrio sp. FNV 38]
MKKLIIFIATSFMLSPLAFAEETVGHTSLKSSQFGTKAEAYDAGFAIVNKLSSLAVYELDYKLRPLDGWDSSIYNTKVTIDELSSAPGTIEYQASVSVDYTYMTDY